MPYNEASWERNQLVKKPSNGDTAGNSVGVGGGSDFRQCWGDVHCYEKSGIYISNLNCVLLKCRSFYVTFCVCVLLVML